MSAEQPSPARTTTTVLSKPWYESKTLWVNALGLIILALGIILDSQELLALPT